MQFRTVVFCLVFFIVCIQWSSGAEATLRESAKSNGVCTHFRRRLISEMAKLLSAYENCIENSYDGLILRKRAPEMLWDIEWLLLLHSLILRDNCFHYYY